ncbi:MAG: glycosyltransferase family 39 protein [Phycisphaerae bacterium]|nr:glycosyltransferase family 39 protein [Phycisphaerae bacterium]
MTVIASDAASKRDVPFVLIGLIYALALATRLTFLSQGMANPVLRVPFVDESINWEVAKTILHGHLRPVSYVRSPGYMYVLAGLARSLDEDAFHVRVAHAFLDALSPVLMLLIGARLFGVGAGIAAGILGAIYWTCVLFSCQLLDTSLTCLLCLTLVYLLVRLPHEWKWKWLICGIVAGVAAAARPNLLIAAPVIASVLFVRGRATRWLAHRSGRSVPSDRDAPSKPWLQGVLLILGCAAGIAPVTLRNRIVGGEWVPVCISGGVNMWIANKPGADGKDIAPVLDDDTTPIVASAGGDPWEWCLTYQMWLRYGKKHLGPDARYGQIDRLFTRMFLKSVLEHPYHFVGNLFKRICWTFNVYEFPNNNDPYEFTDFSSLIRLLSRLHFGIVCPLALLGIVLAFKSLGCRSTSLVCYLSLLAALVLTGAMFVVNARYRLPMVCALMPLAGYALARLATAIRHPRCSSRSLAGMVALLAVLGVFCNVNLFGYRPAQRPIYLEWFFATACDKTGATEFLPQAVDRLGPRMAADAESDRPQAMAAFIRRYEYPFAFLMRYYSRRHDWPQTLRYGALMVRYEPYERPKAIEYFDKGMQEAIRANRPEALNQVLRNLLPVLADKDRETLAELCLVWGTNLKSEDMLVMAVSVLGELTRQQPDRADYEAKLEEARGALETIRERRESAKKRGTRSTP